MTVGILGLGEVGSAIRKLCKKKHQVYGRTRHLDELKGKSVDVLHLCYPYTKTFVQTAVNAIRELKPSLVINESSVKPGTTEEIYKKTQVPIVHSPVIAKHPGIYQYLFEAEKIIGPVDEKSYKAAKDYYQDLGLKTIRFKSPLESEIAKILCTTYYGWNIIFEKFVHRVCGQFGADFSEVYTKLNELYNRCYKKTMPHVTRPILKHMPGPIGGHCVIPNAKILNQWLADEFSTFLLIQNEKEKKKSKQKP